MVAGPALEVVGDILDRRMGAPLVDFFTIITISIKIIMLSLCYSR